MKLATISCFLIMSFCFITCEKTSGDDLLTFTIVAESGNATGGITINKCYIDLYDGRSYAYDQAKANAAKIDFVYWYDAGVNPSFYNRGLSNIYFSGYSTGFDTATVSLIDYGSHYGVTDLDFNNLKTAADIDRLQNQKHIEWVGNEIRVLMSDLYTDSSYSSTYAFVTNNAKKGFFKILPFTPKVSGNDKAELTLIVKIQK